MGELPASTGRRSRELIPVGRTLYRVIAAYGVQQVLTPAVLRNSFELPSAHSFVGMSVVLVSAFTKSERLHGFSMLFFSLLLVSVLVSFRSSTA